jgi:NitT/TauT family transport system substrate-binding protein
MNRRTVVAGLLPVLLLTAACGSGSKDSGSDAGSVTLTLNWYPYGEHAPFYYGLKQGIFKKHGIDLKIQAGQGSGKTVQAIGGGQGDFGWADTSALLAAVDKGVPVKSLGVYLQTTPASVQFFSSKDITKPADLKGKTIAATAGDALSKTFPAFLKQNGMSESDVHLQNIDPAGKIAAVLSGKTDALLGYASDQGPTIENKAGKPVSYLRFSDFGLNYYSDGLITSGSVLKDKPDLVKRMVAATSEAWAAAEKDPQAAADTMQGASEQLPPAPVVLGQFKTTLTLLHTDATKTMAPGVNTAEDWKTTIDTFLRTGLITKAQPPASYWAESVAPRG